MENIQDDFCLEDVVLTKEDAKEVWEYLKKKDLETAKIFYLHFSEALKISEIAEKMQISQSSVKNKIYRTLKEMKNMNESRERNGK